MTIYDIIKRKPYLAWYVKEPEKLSPTSVLEHILNYGDWEDVQNFIKIVGFKKAKHLFLTSLNKKRANYSPVVKAYFLKYFKISHA